MYGYVQSTASQKPGQRVKWLCAGMCETLSVRSGSIGCERQHLPDPNLALRPVVDLSRQYIRRRSWRTRQPHRQVGRIGSAGGCWPTIGVPPFATGTHLTACYLAVPARPNTSEPEDETGLKCRYPVARRGQSKLVTDDSLPWKATYFCQVLTADEGFGATKFTTDLGKTVVRRWS